MPARTHHPLRRVYAFFYNKKVGVVLILAMALYTLLGTLINQAPDSVYTSSAVHEQFLSEMGARYGGWARIFDVLGFFHIYSSIGFLTVSALLALSILACTVHRVPLLARKATQPRTRVSARFYRNAQYRGQIPSAASVEDAYRVSLEALRARHYRVLENETGEDGERSFYADRNRFAPFGTVAAHAAFIIIIAALTISNVWGLEDTLTIPVGTSVDVGHDSGYRLEATSFNDTYDESGRPTDYVSHLVLHDASGAALAEQDVRVNSPLVYGGYRFHQAAYGFAAVVTVTIDGDEVYSGGIALSQRSADNTYQYGTLALPAEKTGGASRSLVVATPASGAVSADLAAGQALIQVIDVDSDSPLGEKTTDRGGSVEIEGVNVTFERESTYTGITVRRDPGAIWMWVGSILLVLGTGVTFGLRHRRIWVRVVPQAPAGDHQGSGHASSTPTTIEVASAGTLDAGFERHFAALVVTINESLRRADAPHSK